MIVCFGDSITAGQHVDTEKSWPSMVPDTRVAAVPGDTTRLALERFPRDVQESGAEAVIIQFGHNDANRWLSDRGVPRVSPEAFQANLVEMVERSRLFDIQPFFCTLTPSLRSEQHAADCAEYNRILVAMSAYLGVPLVYARWAFDPPDGLLLDGLHLSEAGHRVYAAAVNDALRIWRDR